MLTNKRKPKSPPLPLPDAKKASISHAKFQPTVTTPDVISPKIHVPKSSPPSQPSISHAKLQPTATAPNVIFPTTSPPPSLPNAKKASISHAKFQPTVTAHNVIIPVSIATILTKCLEKSQIKKQQQVTKTLQTLNDFKDFAISKEYIENKSKHDVYVTGRIFCHNTSVITPNNNVITQLYIMCSNIDKNEWDSQYDTLKQMFDTSEGSVVPELVTLTLFYEIGADTKSIWYSGARVTAQCTNLKVYVTVKNIELCQANVNSDKCVTLLKEVDDDKISEPK